MKDKNGREMKTGDIVRISGGFFKNSNGYYYIDRAPGDVSWCGNDYSLQRIRKNGTISTAKYSLEFWPLVTFCSDPYKRAAANEHNKTNATIEVIDTIDRNDIIRHFEEEAEKEDEAAKYYAMRYCEESTLTTQARDLAKHWRAVVDRMTKE